MPRQRRLTSDRAPARALCVPGTLLLAVLVALAAGARADGPSSLSATTRSLDEVESESEGPSRLQDVERQAPAALEGGDRTEELGGFGSARSDTIEGVNQAAQPWQAPPCDLTLPPGVEAPEGDDVDLWRAALAEAEEELARAQARMQRAEMGFVQVNTDPGERSERAPARSALDQARAEYATARCAVPALLEAARRAGVPPGTLREVRDRVGAELSPEEVGY